MAATSFSLFGQVLDPPTRKFDYASALAVELEAYKGIHRFGPYDKNLFGRSKLKAAVICPRPLEAAVRRFVDALREGISGFHGFSRLFHTQFELASEFKLDSEDAREYGRAMAEAARSECDIVFVVPPVGRESGLYPSIKRTLLTNGIPCQVVQKRTLLAGEESFPYIVGNIALSTYAKVGGTPWVIDAEERAEVVLGMSRAGDFSKQIFVGSTTILKHNGDYVLSYSKAPVSKWEEYENGLEELVREAVEQYERLESQVSSLVIHFHKRTGRKEVEAVKRALQSIGRELPFALLHLNSYSGFMPFDPGSQAWSPERGLQVDLGRRQVLLVTSIDIGGNPTTIEITLDRESTVDWSEFPRLVKQVFDFAHVNWRGFNARTVPVTIYYSHLIAQLMGGILTEADWNAIVCNEKLVDKAWFL